MVNLLSLLLILSILAVVIWLQIFLSTREAKWPGLVLPSLAFLYALLYPLNLVVPSEEGVTGVFILQMALVWLLGNIPTVLLLAIYFGCRQKKRRNQQLKNMHVQDLE